MRRFMLLAALCAALVLALTPVVMAQPNPMPNPMPNPNPTPNTGTTQYQAPTSTGTQQMGDVDCAQLTQPQAQAIFDADPSDPNGLDADNDGLACEGNAPTATQYGQSNAETPIIENPRNCDEFGGSQAAAQQFLENVTPGDEFNLDADDDGIACEGLLSGGAEAPTTTATQYETPDVTTTTTATTALPTTGGLPLMPLAGASLLVLGLTGYAINRRVS